MGILETMEAEMVAALSSGRGLTAADALCVTCRDLLEVDRVAVSVVQRGVSYGTFGSSGVESRRLDQLQFTVGEGPGLDAAATSRPVLVPDLDAAHETRWPLFAEAALADGVRAVFALPVVVATRCVGTLDLSRSRPGPLSAVQLAAAVRAARLATTLVVDLLDRIETAPAESPGLAAGGGDSPGDLDRIEVYQAVGMLISQLDVSADDALSRLRAHAVASGRTAREVAMDIVGRTLRLERDDDEGTGQ